MPKQTHAKPLHEKLHWSPVEQRISYKTVVLTFKGRSTPTYLKHNIQTRQCAQDTRSSATPALFEPLTRTNYAKRASRCSAPAVWNSLPRTVLNCVTLSTFKSTLKMFLFSHTLHTTRLTALFSGLPGWAGTRKVKPMWILLKQETGQMPFLPPHQQRQSTEGKSTEGKFSHITYN